MSNALDQTRPADGAKWAFNADVTRVFDNMLRRSIPDYETMRKLVFSLGSRFVQPNTDVVDLGSSRGDALAPFIEAFGAGNRYVGLDESEPMLTACRDRFRAWVDNGLLDVRQHDLRGGLPPLFPSLILAVLTLQFTPIECRQRIVADAYRILRPGGVMIIVEKVLGGDNECNQVLVSEYHHLKYRNGYSADEIDAKRRSLQGVLVPLTAEGNEQMLRAEGFRVQRFWQALNFAGWLAVKPKAGA